MSEHSDQVTLFYWAKLKEVEYPELRWMFAIPNGTRTSPGVAAKMKAEGVLKGASDIFLPCSKGEHHGLFLELKTKIGRASPEQLEFIKAMRDQGYAAFVVHGWEAAAKTIQLYLTGAL